MTDKDACSVHSCILSASAPLDPLVFVVPLLMLLTRPQTTRTVRVVAVEVDANSQDPQAQAQQAQPSQTQKRPKRDATAGGAATAAAVAVATPVVVAPPAAATAAVDAENNSAAKTSAVVVAASASAAAAQAVPVRSFSSRLHRLLRVFVRGLQRRHQTRAGRCLVPSNLGRLVLHMRVVLSSESSQHACTQHCSMAVGRRARRTPFLGALDGMAVIWMAAGSARGCPGRRRLQKRWPAEAQAAVTPGDDGR
jgi:hypothetical protein